MNCIIRKRANIYHHTGISHFPKSIIQQRNSSIKELYVNNIQYNTENVLDQDSKTNILFTGSNKIEISSSIPTNISILLLPVNNMFVFESWSSTFSIIKIDIQMTIYY